MPSKKKYACARAALYGLIYFFGSGELALPAHAQVQGSELGAQTQAQPRIHVDLGPWDTSKTRQALEMRRDGLFFDRQAPSTWQMRVRALQQQQSALSVTLSRSATESYIQEFALDLERQDAERQIATMLMNWVDAVLANEYRPATKKELQAQRQKEVQTPKERVDREREASAEQAPQPEPRPAKKVRATPDKKAAAVRSKARAKSPKKPRGGGAWTFRSPTRWELGLGLGLDQALRQGDPWLPGWSWLYVDAAWTPKRVTRLLARARWQSHALDQSYLHRVRVEVGPQWVASIGRVAVPLGVSISAERWWTKQAITAGDGLTRLVSLGVGAHLGISWRLLQTKSGMICTGLQTQLRFSSEIPGWVIPSVSLSAQGPTLLLGGAQWGLLWTLHWGKAARRPTK